MNTYDFRALQELLHSWGLLDLFQHFKDEGVNIEEMKIMKYHHVQELLQNFKLGIRIRFDYHYERWRRNLHKPLHTPYSGSNVMPAATCYTNCDTYKMQVDKPNEAAYQHGNLKRRRMSRTTSVETNEGLDSETLVVRPSISPALSVTSITRVPTPPQIASTTEAPSKPPKGELAASSAQQETVTSDLAMEMPKLTPQPKRLVTSDANNVGTEKPRASIPLSAPRAVRRLPSTSTVPLLIGETLRMNSIGGDPLKALEFYESMEKTSSLSIMRILQTSGRKGLEILDYYQRHSELKQSHRWLLINLIVNFFDDNNLHLSLNMSHHLEKQILDTFPTEKLEYYRTEKRGRIYVKFSNMKRYQRDRSGIKRKWNKSVATLMDKDVEIVDGNAEDDNCSLTLENWTPELPTALDDADAEIKTEVITGEDFI